MSIERERHIRYFATCLLALPQGYVSLDTQRLTLAHFAVQGLALLGVWEEDDDDSLFQKYGLVKQHIIEWIYSLQIDVSEASGSDTKVRPTGFVGGTSALGTTSPADGGGHIAMNYTALATLKTLGDDWSRVDRPGLLASVAALQQENGSFQSIVGIPSETDLRFLYCACAISHMLQDWSPVDIGRACSYIESCRSFDGGFALVPGQEGHGGSTYCALASLALMGKLDMILHSDWKADLIRWCVHRQQGGMQGRPGKDEDTCYSFWIGGTLRILQKSDALLDHGAIRAFILSCQSSKYGGFGKVRGAPPDLLHSYYSLAWLALSKEHEDTGQLISLKELDCLLGIPKETA